MWFVSLLFLLLFIYVLHIIVYALYRNKNVKRQIQSKSHSAVLPHITIIIAVRNESEHIHSTLTSVLNQRYPKDRYNVIIVDDFSEDNTLEILYKIDSPHLKILSLHDALPSSYKNIPNKKRALTLGIEHAIGDIILCTDGDVILPETWIATIANAFENNETQFVAAPVLFRGTNTLLTYFQNVDMLSMIGIGAASMAMNTPYLCNGANMAFRKKAFQHCGGFEKHLHIAGGDDILLMQEMARKWGMKSVYYLELIEATVYTQAEKSYEQLFHQRIRWMSKASAYSYWSMKATLVFMYVFHTLLFICIPLSIFISELRIPILLTYISKTSIDFLFINYINKTYKVFFKGIFMPIFEYMYIAYIAIAGTWALKGTYKWKNRWIQHKNK